MSRHTDGFEAIREISVREAILEFLGEQTSQEVGGTGLEPVTSSV